MRVYRLYIPGMTGQPVTDTNKLIYQGPACVAVISVDAAVTTKVSGAGTGEHMSNCKGYGLCALYQQPDFSKPEFNPQNWGASTDLCGIDVAGKKSDISSTNTSNNPYFEYNIQRTSTSTILNNFYDEYSSFLCAARRVSDNSPIIWVHVPPTVLRTVVRRA